MLINVACFFPWTSPYMAACTSLYWKDLKTSMYLLPKYHLVAWKTLCASKTRGGLVIKDISRMNISLLCKWWWKLEIENGLWQELVGKKYLRGNPISVINQRHDNSPIWTDLQSERSIWAGESFKLLMGKGPYSGKMFGYIINLFACSTQCCLTGVKTRTLQFTMFWKEMGEFLLIDGSPIILWRVDGDYQGHILF